MPCIATRTTSRLLAIVAALWLVGGGVAQAQEERRPAEPTEGVYRSERLGIEYQLVEHRGHFAAKIVKVVSTTAPVLWVRMASGLQQLEPGDLIVSLDDQVLDSSRDVDNHVDETTVDVVDSRTGQSLRGVMKLPPAVAVQGGSAAESRTVRALLVIDKASNLAGLDEDRQHVESILQDLRRQGRAQVTVLERQGEATAQGVQNFFRAQPDASADTVLFYYSGHGATDPRLGHFLAPTIGPRLLRSTLRQEIARLRPRTTIILTDCCSNVVRLPPSVGAAQPGFETARDLFLRAAGIVDVTAATYDPTTGTEESAWCDPSGGFFTTELNTAVLNHPREDLDRDRDGRVSWTEFAPVLVDATNQRYLRFRTGVLSGEGTNDPRTVQALRNQPRQRPQVFSLGAR